MTASGERPARSVAARPEDPIHVLHVEDDPDFSRLARTALTQAADRITVESTASPQAALDRIDDARVDCVVCDYDLDELDGLDLLGAVRSDYPDLPFILFTGKGSEEIASEAVSAGVTDYLQKAVGTDQFTVLANRIENAVTARRNQARADRHERIASVIREVNRGLVGAGSRAAIDATVCAALADADPYRFAWIGEYDPDTREIVPRHHAGIEAGYLDAIDVPVGPDDDSLGPTARAFRTGAVQVMQHIAEDPAYRPWRDQALERGYRSSAAVPLVYEGSTYGVLNVYADRPSAFDDTECAVLEELGTDVAHAIHAVELQETFRRYREAVEHAGHAVYMTDADGTIRSVNPAFEAVTGYDEASVVGRTPEFLYADPDAFETVLETVTDGGVWEEDLAALTAAGERYHVTGTIAPITGVDGTVDGVVAVHADVTERAERERALARLEQRLALALEGTRTAIWEYDVETETIVRHEGANALWAEDTTQPVPLDAALAERVHPDDRRKIRTAIDRAVDEAAPYRVEFRLRTAEGWVWVESRGERHREGPDDPGRLIGFVTDISDRRDRAAELERYETIIEASGDAVYTIDASGHITFVNDAFCALVGYEESDLIGAYVDVVMDETDIERGERLIRELLTTDESRGTFEMDLIRADGEHVTVENHIALLPYEDEFRGTTGIHRVITDRKRRERELERQNERLEQFASVLSHDLRSPLAVAHGYLDLLNEDIEGGGADDHDQTAEAVDKAMGAVERMGGIIEDVLALARDGRSVQDPRPVDLGTVAEAAWETVTTDAATLTVPTDVTVAADEQRLRRLFENLIRNAVEHGGAGVEVTVTAEPGGFAVADDGPGLSVDAHDRVFESGYTTGEGTGFGLAIVRQIAEAHGWTVTAGEGPDGGARFVFSGVDRGVAAEDPAD